MTNSMLDKLIAEVEKHTSEDFKESQFSLQQLVNILGDIIDELAIAKIKGPTWKRSLETLTSKILFTSNSLITLSNGFKLQSFKNPNLSAPIIDISSLYILTRAIIENYVTLCYIYNNDLSEEEKIFRYKLWEVSGLITRQNFEDPNGFHKTDQIAKEAEIIKKILSEIESSEEYKSLDKRKLNKLQSHGLPRIDSWHKLINESKLNRFLFANAYSLFSEYAHSEYLSVLQIEQSNYYANSKDTTDNAVFPLSITKMIITLLIKFYVQNFKVAEEYFNSCPAEYKVTVRILSNIAEKNTNNGQPQ